MSPSSQTPRSSFPDPSPELCPTFHIPPLCVLRRFHGLPGPLQKDARRKTMQFPGTNVSRSLTGTQLVTKRVMSLHPHNPQFWSQVKPSIPHTLNRYSRTKVQGIFVYIVEIHDPDLVLVSRSLGPRFQTPRSPFSRRLGPRPDP